ncbi:flagellar biosynthesis protein FliQ [Desulfothermus naphthae]
MTPDFVVGFAKDAIELTLLLSMPMLGIGLIVGVIISIIQAATQIQEMTLSFIPKILAIFLALLVSFPWLMDKMITFTRQVIENIPNIIG